MDEHQDTGTGWPAPPAGEPDATLEPAAAAEPVEPVEPAGERPVEEVREWDVDGPDVDAPEPAPVSPSGDTPVPTPSRRRRLSATGAMIGVLLVLFGFAFVVQLRSHSTDTTLSTARPEDLVRILSDLDARKDRLSEEISQLRTTQQQLAAGSPGRAAALDAAAKRARDLGILAGTLPTQGPGIIVHFIPGSQGLKAAVILDAVEELRDAGAEAMQIEGGNGQSVRIIASTWFVDGSGGGLEVDGSTLTGPYVLTAIGDPPTMRTALNIPGGVDDTVHNAGGNVIVEQPGTVRVTTLHPADTPHYAQPAS
jgi:uncharacterized protein YlxW (UPF0749 family)